jgi:GTPase
VSPSAEEFESLQIEMKSRIGDGQGETIYEIGMGGGDNME